jgi:hypothetical protein
VTKSRYLFRNTNVYSCLINWSFKLQSNMEFLYGIFSRGFWASTRVFSDSSFYLVFYLIFTFYKMLFMKTRVSWFSIIILLFHKMLFMYRLEFSCFAVFFVRIFKTREEYGFLYSPPVERTVNNIEQKTRVFCQNDAQEFHLRKVSLITV